MGQIFLITLYSLEEKVKSESHPLSSCMSRMSKMNILNRFHLILYWDWQKQQFAWYILHHQKDNSIWESPLWEHQRYMPSHRRTSIHQLALRLPVVEVLPQWAFPSPSSPPLPRRGVPHPLPVLCQPPSNCLTPHLNPFHLLPWRFNKGSDTRLPQAIPLSQQRELWSCKSHCKLPTYLSDFVSLFVSVFLCSSQLVLDKGDRIRPAQLWISASMANLE